MSARVQAPERSSAAALPAGGALLAGLLTLPLVGLALLIVAPGLDVRWEHHPAHFWLVLAAGGLNAALAYSTGVTARRRRDARVFLVSLAFLSAAGFLGLHALATPGVLLDTPNRGFAMATPVGLIVAGLFAAASGTDLMRPGRVMERSRILQNGLVGLMALWGIASLARLPPFDANSSLERASGALLGVAVVGVALYAIALVLYVRLWRRKPSQLLMGMAIAFALLMEAMIAVAFGRNWHATWWEWHLLMLAAFGFVALTAHRQWHEERFSDLYVEDTAAGRREISVLFADLKGFTSFSEAHPPAAVTAMLNEYFEVAIPPIVRRHGGQIDRLIGDALMATFNRTGDQPDHALRAARAALAIQEATAAIAARHEDWPRFRVGVNTGEALLGVLGTAGGRTHTAIGDTVNLASRLEGAAPVGGVAIGAETARQLPGARTEPLGSLTVKGKAEPVEAFSLVAID